MNRYPQAMATRHPLSNISTSPHTKKTQTIIKIIGPNSLTFEGRQNSSPDYSKKHK